MTRPTDRQVQTTLIRLLPRLQARFYSESQASPTAWLDFLRRLNAHFERLFDLYYQLYAGEYDFYYHLENLLVILAEYWLRRPEDLQALDGRREADPLWFQSNRMLGGVVYVDLFAGSLAGIREKIPYFKEIKLTYLHLMPLFLSPEGENDGGYAVSSYRQTRPELGTIEQLAGLARDLRENNISLVVDLVFNHTSHEHEWARKAQAGDQELQDYYRIFPDRQVPDLYEANLREIFPGEHPGAFTFWPGLNQWVWTTFHSYQWDLNYANPVVFNRMVEEMLFLANIGVEVLRLDAVAFIWKRMGTNCENLPEAHILIQAFNAAARIAAPALLFKSEAIVHPDEVAKYISPDECQLSYNPLLMALLWESLATRRVELLARSLSSRYQIDPLTAWVNYVRCHDDIGWTFSDQDANRLGINGFDHRKFLNSFYTGQFEGSFGRGLPFQENPKTGDARISGTCASLAGLEKSVFEETGLEVELAIRRILLIHAVILTIGGIPLIYLGDELGALNDYSYREDPAKSKDSRWVHRLKFNWAKSELRKDRNSIEGRIFIGLRRLIELRINQPALSGQEMQVIDTGNPHVLGYLRSHGSQRIVFLANFSETEGIVPAEVLRQSGPTVRFEDLLTGQVHTTEPIHLAAYQFCAVLAGPAQF